MSIIATRTLPRGGEWHFEMLGALASPAALRVFTVADVSELVRRFRPGAADSTVYNMIDRLISAGAFRRVTAGVFLNRRALPPAEPYEAATHLRSGAVVSLHFVLGEIGVLNNPSDVVTCVLPSSTRHRPRLGDLQTRDQVRFRFYGLSERFFPTDDADRTRLLQPGRPCEMFRPEAALLQWLHLARNARSAITGLPQDVDLTLLDLDLLEELARRWILTEVLVRFREGIADE
jgi:hypothetical protein